MFNLTVEQLVKKYISPLFVLVDTLVYPPVEAVEPTDNTVKLSFLAQLFKTKRM